MGAAALGKAAREAGGRIVAAIAARFRDLDIAEEAFAEACARAAAAWPDRGAPCDPAAWLYRVAQRCALDEMRRRRTRERHRPEPPAPAPTPEEIVIDDAEIIPDERLRLIFVCCHPAVSIEARAALTLRLVCGLSIDEIARAFLLSDAALSQRLTRAKRKIRDAGVPFEVPGPAAWHDRLDAVLSTLEIAYAKAHEDAAGEGPRAWYASEVLRLTRILAELVPEEPDAPALAAMVRYAEARRPARVDDTGAMVPLSEQDPVLWDRPLIAEANSYQAVAEAKAGHGYRVVQARIHRAWCARRSLDEPPPWSDVLALYDTLVERRDDPIVRLNRAVALAEVAGVAVALDEVQRLDRDALERFLPYHAVRADLLRRSGRGEEAREAYEAALALGPTSAERRWLQRRRDACHAGIREDRP